MMDYAHMIEVLERHEQAEEALKLIMRQQELAVHENTRCSRDGQLNERLVRVECAEFGTRRSMWVTYRGADGVEERQFSWDTQTGDDRLQQELTAHENTRYSRDGLLNWIFDAYVDYRRVREIQQQTDYEQLLPQQWEAILRVWRCEDR